MFITLTGRKGLKIPIRTSLIASFIRDTDDDYTSLIITGNAIEFHVQETPEQIMEMIENARN